MRVIPYARLSGISPVSRGAFGCVERAFLEGEGECVLKSSCEDSLDPQSVAKEVSTAFVQLHKRMAHTQSLTTGVRRESSV